MTHVIEGSVLHGHEWLSLKLVTPRRFEVVPSCDWVVGIIT